MKKVVIAIVLIIAGVLIFKNRIRETTVPFSVSDPKTTQFSPATSPQNTPRLGATTTKKFIPPGFRGPTGEPHIIGPSGPPPNY